MEIGSAADGVEGPAAPTLPRAAKCEFAFCIMISAARSDTPGVPTALCVFYEVAQSNFRKPYNQLFEARNLLLAALQLVLFVCHHRWCATIAAAEMIHVAPFPIRQIRQII
ncbi:hypothetical protein XH80_24195 [Bradyrhizobium sp. CCBAU 45384]|nr:hypothetical protein [Bradyrhizobium sp. CCBAU 45384]